MHGKIFILDYQTQKNCIYILTAAVLCAALSPLVPVEYDIADYLPKDAQSTATIKIIEDNLPRASQCKGDALDVSVIGHLTTRKKYRN